jgi:hypothetical protein
MVSPEDVARVEKIVEALDPEVAIQTALTSYSDSYYPLSGYLKTQGMRINRIFNEYGVEFSVYSTYTGLSNEAQIVFTKLKSRYSYLDSLELKQTPELQATLELLKE